MPQYVVLQVTLKEKFIGTSSKNLKELEDKRNALSSTSKELKQAIEDKTKEIADIVKNEYVAEHFSFYA